VRLATGRSEDPARALEEECAGWKLRRSENLAATNQKWMSEDQGRNDLEIYLRDHYAGAVSALELLDHMVSAHSDDSLGKFFEHLRAEIKADHQQLQNLIEALGFKESSLRNTGAWLAEKLGRAKVGFTAGEDARLRLLQSLETLSLGITGKKLLWRALIAAQDSSGVLQRTDLAHLEARAVEQAEKVETQRLAAAKAAFCAS
jgi:hypothetical protein